MLVLFVVVFAELRPCGFSMFGAVVVGVGTAGSVRIRDMLAPLPGSPAENLSVKGLVSRYQGLALLSVLNLTRRGFPRPSAAPAGGSDFGIF